MAFVVGGVLLVVLSLAVTVTKYRGGPGPNAGNKGNKGNNGNNGNNNKARPITTTIRIAIDKVRTGYTAVGIATSNSIISVGMISGCLVGSLDVSCAGRVELSR